MEHTLASRISSLMLRLAAVLGLAFAFALLGASFSASADDSPTDGLLAAVAYTVDAVIPQPVSAEPASPSPEADATAESVVAPLLDTAVMPIVDSAVLPVVDSAVAPVVAPLLDPVVAAVVTTADPIVTPVVSSIATPVLDSVDRVVNIVNRVVPAAILAGPFADVTGTATVIVVPGAAPGDAAVSRSALPTAPVNAAPQLASALAPLTSPVDRPLKSPLRPPLGSPGETPATIGAAGSVTSAADIQSTGLPARTIGGADQLSPTEYPAPSPSFEHDSSPD